MDRIKFSFLLISLICMVFFTALIGNGTQVTAFYLTETPSLTPNPTVLLSVATKSSFEIYDQPTTSSERLVAAAEAFSPYVAGANADYRWVYIYFFTPQGMQDGWIRSTRMNLDEATLNSLPIIDPNNPPSLPILTYDEDAAPISLREAILEATANAGVIEDIIFYLDTCTPSVIQEGDSVSFLAPVTHTPRQFSVYINGRDIPWPFLWTATVGEKQLNADIVVQGRMTHSWECEFEVTARNVAVVPTQVPLDTSTLMTVTTKNSFEIYVEPTTSSERLVAAADSFSPYVVGKNADYSWVYLYFFMPEGMQAGWIRSTRMNLDETALNILPIIDPDNPPSLPTLEYDEQAAPVYVRESVIQATTDASSVREIYVVAPVQWSKVDYICYSVDGSPIREGDIVYFSFTNYALNREDAENVRWRVSVDGKLIDEAQMSYVIEENVGEASGEWTLPFRIWSYAAWTAEGGSHEMWGQATEGAGGGVRQQTCTIEVEPRPWMTP